MRARGACHELTIVLQLPSTPAQSFLRSGRATDKILSSKIDRKENGKQTLVGFREAETIVKREMTERSSEWTGTGLAGTERA